jgi:hypothetical protein
LRGSYGDRLTAYIRLCSGFVAFLAWSCARRGVILSQVVFPRKAVAAEGPHRLEINSEFLKQNVVDGEAYLLGMTIRHLARHGLGAGWACAGYGDRETVARPP